MVPKKTSRRKGRDETPIWIEIRDKSYLDWFKRTAVYLSTRDDCSSLLSSDVTEPLGPVWNGLTRDWSQREIMSLLSSQNQWGHPELLRQLAKRYNIGFRNIVTTNGVSNGLFLLCKTVLRPDDEVLVESPCYEPLWATPRSMGAQVRFLRRLPPKYQIDTEELGEMITERTRMVILSNLHNPTGTQLGKKELMEVLGVVKKANRDTMVVVDEIYLDFAGIDTRSAASYDEGFTILSSLTKVYGLGQLRCGWIISDSENVENIRKVQAVVEGVGSRFLETMDVMVLRNIREFWGLSNRTVKKNRAILADEIDPLIAGGYLEGQIPKYGCVYFPKVEGVEDTEALCRGIARRFRVYVTPGRFFGDPSRIRIGFGGDEDELRRGLKALSDGLEAYRRMQG